MSAAPPLVEIGAVESLRERLVADLARIRALLQGAGVADVSATGAPAAAANSVPTPLDVITERLGLSAFERDVLLLAAGVELDGEVAEAVAAAQDGQPWPTFALAMATLPGAHWDALLPQRPLRLWRLLHLGAGPTLTTRGLQIDEHVLHTITGLADDAAPAGLPTSAAVPTTLTARQSAVADELALAAQAVGGPVLVHLDGTDPDALTAVAMRLGDLLGLPALVIDPQRGQERSDLETLALVIDREAALGDRLPVVADPRLAGLLRGPVVVVLGEVPGAGQRIVLSRTLGPADPAEQRDLWHHALPAALPTPVAEAVADLAQHYRLGARAIEAVAREWAALHGTDTDLRRLARERARVSLGILAERLDPRATWADLVLPDGQLLLLHDLVRQVRHRAQVYEDWGFARTSTRGFGVTALFTGESGTGKTMAAEVIATDLGLDLYRIDLSAVVSKYIGETEKNLRAVFEAAEAGGAVLVFDEADALFGKRSDVKDSHDRYANLEVAYLLQRMESYRGVAILTTNLRENLDHAFLRRLRFVIQFPFPDEEARRRIWTLAFPPQTPTEGLDPAALARMQVAGGTIRSIALSAAFAAADAGTAVRPEHVLQAARVEYAKGERTLTESERRGIGGPS